MLAGFHLSPTERVVAWRLREARLVSTDELIRALYGGDPDGGPLCAVKSIEVRIHCLRRKLSRHGLSIETVHGRGYFVPASQLAAFVELLAQDIAAIGQPGAREPGAPRIFPMRYYRRSRLREVVLALKN